MYASLNVSAETFGLLSIFKDLGWRLYGESWGDANAALGIINRSGLEKTRHIDTSLLWIQQVAAEQPLTYKKTLGTDNPADLFTKHFDEKASSHHADNLGFKAIGRRSEDAPQLHVISISVDEYQNGGNHDNWEWLPYLFNDKHRNVKSVEPNNEAGDINLVSGLRRATNAISQVLRGSIGQYRGPTAGMPPS